MNCGDSQVKNLRCLVHFRTIWNTSGEDTDMDASSKRILECLVTGYICAIFGNRIVFQFWVGIIISAGIMLGGSMCGVSLVRNQGCWDSS